MRGRHGVLVSATGETISVLTVPMAGLEGPVVVEPPDTVNSEVLAFIAELRGEVRNRTGVDAGDGARTGVLVAHSASRPAPRDTPPRRRGHYQCIAESQCGRYPIALGVAWSVLGSTTEMSTTTGSLPVLLTAPAAPGG